MENRKSSRVGLAAPVGGGVACLLGAALACLSGSRLAPRDLRAGGSGV